jgi:hypothetical protein
MSLTIFFAVCILGLDFMILVLFKWLYGEKTRNLGRSAPRAHTAASRTPVYYVSDGGNSQTSAARAGWRAIPGRPCVVRKSNTAVSPIEQPMERNGSGKYPSPAPYPARRRA